MHYHTDMTYSVVIPTYNRCIPLQRAIDSVLSQSYKNIEIIVVDDGSTDDTATIVAERYPDIIYRYQPNQGPAAARNHGIQYATGEYIALLDSDDRWHDGKIQTEQQLFQRYPQAGAISGNTQTYIQKQLSSADGYLKRDIVFHKARPQFFDWSQRIMERGPTCFTSTLCFKRSTLAYFDFQPFDESLRFDEDWDFEFRLFNHFPVLLYPDIVCERHINDDGTRHYYSPSGKHKSAQEQYTIWVQQQKIIDRYLENHQHASVRERFIQRRNLLAQHINQYRIAV